jgi:hypothetical protein
MYVRVWACISAGQLVEAIEYDLQPAPKLILLKGVVAFLPFHSRAFEELSVEFLWRDGGGEEAPVNTHKPFNKP